MSNSAPLSTQTEKDQKIDTELEALRIVTAAMEPLDDAARIRILHYLASRFFINLGVSHG